MAEKEGSSIIDKSASLSIDKSDISKEEEWQQIPRSTRAVLTLWHLLSGCMALLVWNIVLNVTMLFEIVLWPGSLFADIIMGSHQAGSVVAIGLLIILDRQTYSKVLARATPIVALISICLLPIPSYVMTGPANANKAKGLYCFIVFLIGICSGVYNTQGFAFSQLVPRRRDQSIFMSTGNGLGGVLSWIVFTICFEGIFDIKSVKQTGHLILVMSLMAALLAILTAFVQELSFRVPLLDQKLKEVGRMRAPSIIDPNAIEEGKPGAVPGTTFMSTVKQCAFPAFEVGFVLLVTIFIFPGSGPLKWPMSQSLRNINMGVFQVLDLVFRFIPALGSWTIFGKIPTRIVVFIRPLFLVPLFVIPVYYHTVPFLSNQYWLTCLMVIFVLTNGWFMTCAIVHCMGTAKNKKEAETTANIMTMSIVLGALLGAFGSKLPLLAYVPPK